MNFAVLEPPVKVLSTKFGRAVPTYDHSTKVFSTKWLLLPESFPLYGVHCTRAPDCNIPFTLYEIHVCIGASLTCTSQ